MQMDRDNVIRAVTDLMREMLQGTSGEIDLSDFVTRAVDADFAYMRNEGILIDDESRVYDDDEAYDYIVEALLKQGNVSDEEALDIAELVETYMEVMERYMEEADLLEWE